MKKLFVMIMVSFVIMGCASPRLTPISSIYDSNKENQFKASDKYAKVYIFRKQTFYKGFIHALFINDERIGMTSENDYYVLYLDEGEYNLFSEANVVNQNMHAISVFLSVTSGEVYYLRLTVKTHLLHRITILEIEDNISKAQKDIGFCTLLNRFWYDKKKWKACEF